MAAAGPIPVIGYYDPEKLIPSETIKDLKCLFISADKYSGKHFSNAKDFSLEIQNIFTWITTEIIDKKKQKIKPETWVMLQSKTDILRMHGLRIVKCISDDKKTRSFEFHKSDYVRASFSKRISQLQQIDNHPTFKRDLKILMQEWFSIMAQDPKRPNTDLLVLLLMFVESDMVKLDIDFIDRCQQFKLALKSQLIMHFQQNKRPGFVLAAEAILWADYNCFIYANAANETQLLALNPNQIDANTFIVKQSFKMNKKPLQIAIVLEAVNFFQKIVPSVELLTAVYQAYDHALSQRNFDETVFSVTVQMLFKIHGAIPKIADSASSSSSSSSSFAAAASNDLGYLLQQFTLSEQGASPRPITPMADGRKILLPGEELVDDEVVYWPPRLVS